ncbi:class I SAM-dependent methyltransferase [Flavobacterium sp.]|uniref:class I SAM-dependent methyltransferase n=1 Tax=Flavobacterium sp. TaxID=239 RepID=UPI00262FDCA7|nr:class I SAM-dependent methyltransferase [Flavobacterium sp.]
MKADFDQAAATYDTTFTHTVIGQLQRALVYNQLTQLISNHTIHKVLEVNCGTGEDAIWLAKQGFEVTATDISKAMIATAKAKENPNDITYRQADINDLSVYFPNEKFDLIFSNFGGLNCLSKIQMELFFKNAANLLTEKGQLILIIMPRNTLWEQGYFLLKGKFESVFRRKKENALANVDGQKVLTYYYNPKETLTLAGDSFDLKQQNPIGFFVPPSYLEPFFKTRPRFMGLLNALERKITTYSFLAKYADHYLIAFEKK